MIINVAPESSLLLILLLLSFIALFFVSSFLYVTRRQSKATYEQFLHEKSSTFYFRIHKKFFGNRIDSMLFSLSIAQNILRVLYVWFTLALFIDQVSIANHLFDQVWHSWQSIIFFFILLFAVTLSIVANDLLTRIWTYYYRSFSLKISTLVSTPILLLLFPITLISFRCIRFIAPHTTFFPLDRGTSASKETLLDLIRDINDGQLTDHDEKLLQSVLTFRDRIAREVMVPRVNLFCIPISTTIREAAELIEREGYSRVPVYKNTIDEIVGVLMHKDVLLKYLHADTSTSIESIIKKPLFTPETKKISQLLQEFRNKQTHIAIVVDEYGGTAGIVTIEDILEEIVGEIADEYDEEAVLFRKIGKNSYIVDGHMNLLDLQEETGIIIPQEGEYDTVAGYIFFRLGLIPPKGTKLHHDTFEIEILASNERLVEKVKIIEAFAKPR